MKKITTNKKLQENKHCSELIFQEVHTSKTILRDQFVTAAWTRKL